MSDGARLRRRLDTLLGVDPSPAIAYPLRARLARVVHEATSWLDDLPPDGHIPPAIPELVRRLRDASDHIMQPSEPFDGRWEAQWARARADAEALRALLP